MKIIIYHQVPFALAHGGLQNQILRTHEALQGIGLEVEFLRWYDGGQSGDILHFFGRLPRDLGSLARQKGMRIVVEDLLTEQGSRSLRRLALQKAAIRFLEAVAPRASAKFFDWDAYRRADACIANTPWEADLISEVFRTPAEKIHVLPNGVEEVFLQSRPVERGRWLICTATITERKRVLELARAAVQAQTPLRVVGRPYSDTDPYAKQFLELARAHPDWIRYEGAITDRAKLAAACREARGFVLLSAMETLSLSAGEAAACACPLLLSDLPWARSVYQGTVSYCPVTAATEETARHLRKFYDAAPSLDPAPPPPAWSAVARRLKAIYEGLPSTSR